MTYLTEEKKKKNNLGTYAVIMILAAVFIIIIAAMADNRENQFETQINEQTQINVGIQDKIVRLEDENYRLKKAAEEQEKISEPRDQALTVYRTLSEVYALALEGKSKDAAEKLKEIDPSVLTEEEKAAYDTLQKQLKITIK